MLKRALAAALLFAALMPSSIAMADQSSTCMPTTGVVSGLVFAQSVNAAHEAFISSHSGTSAPSNDCSGVPITGQPWLDTSSAPSSLKTYDATNWLVIGKVDATAHVWTPPVGGGATSVASAATADLWSVAPAVVTVTGSTAITKLAGSGAVTGTVKFVVFSGALTLTYNATQLITPTAANIAVAAGDTATIVALGGGNVRVVAFTRADGTALAVVQQVPTGQVAPFLLASCPASWVQGDGGTIGDASSGATDRANADTLTLFSAMWALAPSVAPIFTSAGGASTRGGSAAADFAAHKRITVMDLRAVFLRGLDDGRSLDAGRVLGSQQADSLKSHNHTASASSSFTGNALPGHTHSVTVTSAGNAWGANAGSPPAFRASGGDQFGGTNFSMSDTSTSVSAGTPSGTVSTSVTVNATGGGETRPVNVAVLQCVKL